MLYNLRAEMARRGVRISDLSKILDITERAVNNKISGRTTFSYPEVQSIRDTFFHGMEIEYLFHNDGAVAPAEPKEVI